MPGPLYRFLAADHACLDLLLQKLFAQRENVGLDAYARFRAGYVLQE